MKDELDVYCEAAKEESKECSAFYSVVLCLDPKYGLEMEVMMHVESVEEFECHYNKHYSAFAIEVIATFKNGVRYERKA